MTVAPLVANGVVIVGVAGAEFGHRGYLEGSRPADRQAAVADLHGSGQGRAGIGHLAGQLRPDRRRHDLDHRLVRSRARPRVLGHRQPGAVESARTQGRQPPHQFDPRHPAQDRQGRLAYQTSPGDPFDYDGVNELVHADSPSSARRARWSCRPTATASSMCWSGRPASCWRPTSSSRSTGPSASTSDRPSGVDRGDQGALEGRPAKVYPSLVGGKNWHPMSYQPDSKLIYVNTTNFGWDYERCRWRRSPTSSRA